MAEICVIHFPFTSFPLPCLLSSLAMTIGFTSRSQTVSEGDAPPGSDFNRLTIDVATERTSERVHTIVFRHLESRSTAIVQSNFIQHDPLFDALFGNDDNHPIEERFTLQPGSDVIPSRVTSVRNDFRPEEEECYTICIFTTVSCNDDDDMADNFFCLHTICITNDDGRFDKIHFSFLYPFVFSQNRLLLHLCKQRTLLLRVRVQWRCVLISLVLLWTSLKKLFVYVSSMMRVQSTFHLALN